ncbi:MAG: SDR family oxidoreductase [Pseudomonadales bacterium]
MDKIALVTGGGRGIGRATVLALAARGYKVCINYRSDKVAAAALVTQLRERGTDCFSFCADIADEEQVKALFNAVDERLGPITALVNNAALMLPQQSIEALDGQRLTQMFATNITGYFLCAREAVLRMAHKHGGAGGGIVNVSSMAAKTGSPHEYMDYAASKGAIDTMTRGLAMEMAQQGVRVNAVRPGLIYTQMHADGGEPARVDRLKARIPMGRGGEPEEIAEAICWLLSDAASFTTGQLLDVSGGL